MDKLNILKENIKSMGSIAVAFSGGIDSAFLAYVAKGVLCDRVKAIIAVSPLLPQKELDDALCLAKEIGIELVQLEVDELTVAEFVKNDEKRCYFCKRHRFDLLCDWAKENGIDYIVEGSNLDDMKDYRPGMVAVKEKKMMKSPLKDACFTKADIRSMAKSFGISAWDKPSSSCLAARIAYKVSVTRDALLKIERAEEFIKGLLPEKTCVRVRLHGDLARIEVDADKIHLAFESFLLIKDKLKSLGFLYVTIDLEGFSSGSMNRAIIN